MNDYLNKDFIKRTFVFGFRSNPDDDEYPEIDICDYINEYVEKFYKKFQIYPTIKSIQFNDNIRKNKDYCKDPHDPRSRYYEERSGAQYDHYVSALVIFEYEGPELYYDPELWDEIE